MEEMKKRVAKLIDVKSIVTIALTIVFCVLSLIGVVPQEFLAIYTMIIGFYFGTQATKKAELTEVKTAAEPVATVEPTSEQGTEKTVDQAMQNDVHPPDDVTVSER